MKRKIIYLTLLAGLVTRVQAQEEEKKEIEEVVILKTATQPMKRIGDVLYTGTEITPRGIDAVGVVANGSLFNLVNIVPSVNTQTTDAYGLGYSVMRVRGMRNFFAGVTVEGVPNYGVSPIGPREDVFDKENLNSVAIYKGAVPADVFSASGNRGGSVDISFRRSPRQSGLEVLQSFGSNNYMRTYARFNTGVFESGDSKTSAYFSFSFTEADKWKGVGLLSNRKNYSIGVTHHFNDKLSLEVFSNYNYAFRYFFRKLKYNEVMDLEKNYHLDYNDKLTGDPAKDVYYAHYNKGNNRNSTNMLYLSYKPNDNQKFSIKPYYAKEDADYTETNIGEKQKKDVRRDFWQVGVIADWKMKWDNFNFGLGYWHETSRYIPNAAAVVSYKIEPTGLKKLGYRFYNEIIDNWAINNPYVKLAYEGENFKVQAGLKYMAYTYPAQNRYEPKSATDNSPREVASPDMITKRGTNAQWLPSVGLGYQFNKQLEIYANYGRGYMRPYSTIENTYLGARAAFQAQGMSLQSILDSWVMESSDNVDLGLFFNSKKVKINGSIYYGKQNNVLANVFDPRVNATYSQNAGKMTTKGAEIESYFQLAENFQFFLNPSYNSVQYDKDIEFNKKGEEKKIIPIGGKQSPATPKIMIKSGLIYNSKNLSANLFVNHLGERFGDALNKEKVPAYTVFDASLSYKAHFSKVLKNIYLGVEVKNIANKKYIGVIDTRDENQGNGATYLTGFPRTFIGTLKIEF
ncbi:MAG: TonB-dependent receptor [Flavobacteriaceae bacterium]|nr:TonB-dependent receptor [Flavobacteriaceae bacterium]